MDKQSSNSPTHYKWWGTLQSFGKIIIGIIGAGFALLLGFWLMIASNMGSTYLPEMCNGCLDHWIRMLLLGSGIGIWIITAGGLVSFILHYVRRSIRHSR